MTIKKVVLASDHAGTELKEFVKKHLADRPFEVIDLGPQSDARVDYPDYAAKVARCLQNNDAERGILICGTGIGMALSANRFKGVRAASLTDCYSAEMTRRHNDLNVLCLGSRVIAEGLAAKLIDIFFDTEFEGGRHAARVKKLEDL